jgi:hypothetical protein
MTTTTTTVSQAETLANRILDILDQQGVAVWGCYSEPDAAACRDDARRLIVPMLQAAALPTTMTAPAQAQQDRDAAALHAAPDLAPLYDIFYRLNRAALTGKVGDAVAGATDLRAALCSDDRVLLLLLHGARVQQPRDC